MKNKIVFFLFASAFPFSSFAGVKVAITVDDLPTHGELPPGVTREMVAEKMVSVFKKHKVPDATAFINAGKVEVKKESLEVLRIWKNAGYSFGNHTYLHEDLNQVSIEEFKKAIDRNEPLLKELSGSRNWKFFRYPFLREGDSHGKRNAIRNYLKEKGYRIAQVTIDFEDWSWNDPYARCKAKGDRSSIEWLRTTYQANAVDMLDRAVKATSALE